MKEKTAACHDPYLGPYLAETHALYDNYVKVGRFTEADYLVGVLPNATEDPASG